MTTAAELLERCAYPGDRLLIVRDHWHALTEAQQKSLVEIVVACAAANRDACRDGAGDGMMPTPIPEDADGQDQGSLSRREVGP